VRSHRAVASTTGHSDPAVTSASREDSSASFLLLCWTSNDQEWSQALLQYLAGEQQLLPGAALPATFLLLQDSTFASPQHAIAFLVAYKVEPEP